MWTGRRDVLFHKLLHQIPDDGFRKHLTALDCMLAGPLKDIFPAPFHRYCTALAFQFCKDLSHIFCCLRNAENHGNRADSNLCFAKGFHLKPDFSEHIVILFGKFHFTGRNLENHRTDQFLTGIMFVDGSYHAVDSSDMAFKTAARIGFRACCEKADPILLEPMANMAITVPEEYAGSIMSDISTRRGRIVGTDSDDAGDTVILVRVPYAEVVTYTKDLRSISRGTGSYTIDLEGYEEAPAHITKKMVEEYEASRNQG